KCLLLSTLISFVFLPHPGPAPGLAAGFGLPRPPILAQNTSYGTTFGRPRIHRKFVRRLCRFRCAAVPVAIAGDQWKDAVRRGRRSRAVGEALARCARRNHERLGWP